MKAPMRIAALAAGAVATAALLASCGGGGSDTSGEAATIDLAAVETGIEELASVIPICHSGAGLRAPNSPAVGKTAWLARMLELHRAGSLRAGGRWQALGPNKPADTFGDCGGRLTYPSYAHSNGVTTATLEFDNYCSVNDNTGERNIADGSISFVNTGIPSASGPYTDKIEADSPNGVTFDAETSGGATLSSQRISFSDYLLEAGVPGGTPTAANPNEISWREARVADLLTGKSYRQTNVSITEYFNASGSELVSINGRGYRSNGDYYDIRTATPITTASSGAIVGGQLTFTGAGGSQAVMTFVPGGTLQATMTVNGQPVTNVPACH